MTPSPVLDVFDSLHGSLHLFGFFLIRLDNVNTFLKGRSLWEAAFHDKPSFPGLPTLVLGMLPTTDQWTQATSNIYLEQKNKNKKIIIINKRRGKCLKKIIQLLFTVLLPRGAHFYSMVLSSLHITAFNDAEKQQTAMIVMIIMKMKKEGRWPIVGDSEWDSWNPRTPAEQPLNLNALVPGSFIWF